MKKNTAKMDKEKHSVKNKGQLDPTQPAQGAIKQKAFKIIKEYIVALKENASLIPGPKVLLKPSTQNLTFPERTVVIS
jgi:hypothetical protein